MYRRNARSGLQRAEIPFGPLRLDIGPHDAPDGTLARCENARPAGPSELPYYTPLVPPVTRRIDPSPNTTNSIGTRTGDAGTDLVLVTDRDIVVIDPENTHSTVFEFETIDATRRAQFAEVAGTLFITTVTGAFPGAPEHLLELRGLDCREYGFPRLPAVWCSAVTDISDGGLGSSSSRRMYAYRWAYELPDGSLGPLSQPRFFAVGVPANDGWRAKFIIQKYPDTNNPHDNPSAWSGTIKGIALYISQGVDYTGGNDIEKAMDQPLFYAGSFTSEMPELDEVNYSGSESELVSGALLETDSLTQHDIDAGACFSYNQSLILGDVQYDFRPLNSIISFASYSPSRQNDTDYAVKIGVEIRTNKGSFLRYSDPVYIVSGGVASVTPSSAYSHVSGSTGAIQGSLIYPDPRVVSFTVWVDNDNSGGFNLHSTHAASRSDGGNCSYALTGALDLTTTLGALLDEGSRSYDRDPNRIVASGSFLPYRLPAARALYSGRDDFDAVLAFAANTMTSEEGQYGSAPLLVLGRSTVRGLSLADPATGILFSATFPISTKGLVARGAIANSEGLVFYASADGIWSLSPHIGERPLSWSVQSDGATEDIMDDLDENTVMEFVDDNRGNRDLWVFTSSRAWVFATEYGRWFTADRRRSAAIRDGNALYTYDTVSRAIMEEVQHPNDGSLGVATQMEIETHPLRMGLLGGSLRRLYRFGVYQRKAFDQLHYAIYDPLDESDVSEMKNLTTEGDSDSEPTTYETETVIVDEEVTAAPYAITEGAGSVEVTGAGHLEAVGVSVIVDGHKTFPRVDSYEVVEDIDLEVTSSEGLVVQGVEGALIDSGVLQSDRTDIQGLGAAICRDPFVIVTARGKFGQAVESMAFDFEPRNAHRPRKRNY